MVDRRTLLRALWAAPLLTIAGFEPTGQAFAQSEERQRDLDRRLEESRRQRLQNLQRDQDAANQQLQLQEQQRRLREQQLRDHQRQETQRESLENLNQRLRERGI